MFFSLYLPGKTLAFMSCLQKCVSFMITSVNSSSLGLLLVIRSRVLCKVVAAFFQLPSTMVFVIRIGPSKESSGGGKKSALSTISIQALKLKNDIWR